MTIDFGEHSRSLLRFALSLTASHAGAEDLVQETMLRAVRLQREGRLPDLVNPRAWLFTVARNIWRDQTRRRAVHPNQPLELAMDAEQPEEPDLVESREYLSQVLDAFADLPDRQREVLYLRAVEEFPISEIAEITGTSVNSVKASLSIARRRMRERFPNQQLSDQRSRS